jgi:hypothetical protein
VIRSLFGSRRGAAVAALAAEQHLSAEAADTRLTRIRALIAYLLGPTGHCHPHAIDPVRRQKRPLIAREDLEIRVGQPKTCYGLYLCAALPLCPGRQTRETAVRPNVAMLG